VQSRAVTVGAIDIYDRNLETLDPGRWLDCRVS